MEGNEKLYSARYSSRSGRQNALNAWTYNEINEIAEDEINSGFLSAKIAWEGVYHGSKGVYLGILSPKTYGCAVRLRTAQSGPEMPMNGSNRVEIIVSELETAVRTSRISIPATSTLTECDDDPHNGPFVTPLYFGSV